MPSVRIWALESDYDESAIRCLAGKLVEHRGSAVRVYSAGKSAFSKIHRQPDGLYRAVRAYLKQDACVIFVLDADSPMSLARREKEARSLLNQVRDVVRRTEFAGRVHLIVAEQELEAWLLVDCLGIACYFARARCRNLDQADCRAKLAADLKLATLVRKHQMGDTSLITEALPGGRGAKEAVVDFSKEILRALNPRLRPSDVDKSRYREALSPEVARHIEISVETLRHSDSLRRLDETMAGCAG